MSDLDDALYLSVVSTLESLAFVLVEMDDNDPANPDANNMCSSEIIFTARSDDAPSGNYILSVSRNMLPVIAANMLGTMDATPSEEEMFDALREVTNVACGNFLPQLVGSDAVYNVSHPEIVGYSPPPEESLSGMIQMEDGLATASVMYHV